MRCTFRLLALTAILLACAGAAAGQTPTPPDSSSSGGDSAQGKKSSLAAALAANNRMTLSLGWSFGAASFDSPLPAGRSLSGEARGNEPLIAAVAEVGRHKPWQGTLILALANFGRLVEGENSGGGEPDTLTADVRRAVLADLSVRYRLVGSHESVQVLASLNSGFVFDAARGDEDDEVLDAKSYIFAGPLLTSAIGSSAEFHVEFLVGQSEVMTDHELFSREWDKETLRFRPKIGFGLFGDDSSADSSVSITPLFITFWADLGVSEESGDTYVVTFSKPIRIMGG
jgi:hypothetical protein